MKTPSTSIRQVGVIRENQLFSDYRKTVFNIWFDGDQVIDTMSYDELVTLRDILNDAASEYVDNIIAAEKEGGQK
ncbi:MAG: hypothetical protein EGQ00_16055 [Parabacteroides johnsonii]|jgi:hypothetical protein|nr:hypothetical protein [Parabacteroides johnsonii]